MRILFIAHYFLPHHRGGVETYTYHIAKELQKNNEVYIFCREEGYFDHAYFEEDDVFDGIKVKRIYFNEPLTFKTHYSNSALDRHFQKFLDVFNPDVIHIQHLERLSISFIHIAKKREIPVVLTLHDYWFLCPGITLLKDNSRLCDNYLSDEECWHCSSVIPLMLKLRLGLAGKTRCLRLNIKQFLKWLGRGFKKVSSSEASFFVSLEEIRLRKQMTRLALEACDCLLAPSQFLKNKFMHYGLRGDKIIYSDYGFNGDFFKGIKKTVSAKLRFGFIGSIMQHKGVHVLLNAFSQIKEKNVELKLFGEGYDAYFKEIKQRLALDKRIQYRGKFSSQDIGSIHSEIDVLVIPSIWHENSPLVLHEAILAGTPVIASCTGGIPEYVKNMQTGLLFKAGDTQGLLSCMMRFIRDPSLIDLFSNNQKEVSIKSLEEDARQLKRLYVSLRAR